MSSVQGLASSIQWQDLVTSIMAQEKARLLDPVTNAISAAKSGSDAWTQFQTLVKTLNTSAVALRDGAISSVLATGGTTVGGRALFLATPAIGATPGDYETEVMSLARATKVGGTPVASSSTALGLSGDFFVNGKRIVVAATDTLAKIRDTINAANTGSSGSGVAASVNTSSGGVRLVLAASATGSSGIELADGSTEILKQLGLVDGSVTSAVAQPQSFRFTSSSTAIASVLGVSPVPAVTSITVGNTTIPVDLSTDTLAAHPAAHRRRRRRREHCHRDVQRRELAAPGCRRAGRCSPRRRRQRARRCAPRLRAPGAIVRHASPRRCKPVD